jgi:hypothetical protein
VPLLAYPDFHRKNRATENSHAVTSAIIGLKLARGPTEGKWVNQYIEKS